MIPDKKPRDPDSGKLLYLGWLLLKQRNCLQCKRSLDGVGKQKWTRRRRPKSKQLMNMFPD